MHSTTIHASSRRAPIGAGPRAKATRTTCSADVRLSSTGRAPRRLAVHAAMMMTTTASRSTAATCRAARTISIPQASLQQAIRPTQQQPRAPTACRRRHRRALRSSPAVRVAAVFTGIVQGKARVAAVESRPGFTQMTIEFPPGMADTARMGASVAINGTCLTVVGETAQAGANRLAFDLIAETLRATTLGDLKTGDEVNFERAARVGDEIGGHNVSGHVHTTARVVAVQETPDNRRVVLRVEREPERWMRYILPKGFVAVDGCSLTVGEVEGDTFAIYLIPETLRVTTLGAKSAAADGGSGWGRCNIEVEAQTQAVVDTVERVLGDYVSKAVKGDGGPLAEAVRAVVGGGR